MFLLPFSHRAAVQEGLFDVSSACWVRADFLMDSFLSFMGLWTVSSNCFQKVPERSGEFERGALCAQGRISRDRAAAACILWISLNKLQVLPLSCEWRLVIGDLEVHRGSQIL